MISIYLTKNNNLNIQYLLKHLIILILFSTPIQLYAKFNQNIRFEHFYYLNGPIHNGVTSITQDIYGQIWIGSRNGLCKYNGYDLVSYISNPTNKNSIPNNFIKCLAEDKDGYMWIGTDNGICKYNYELNSFERFSIPESTIFKIDIDSNGSVYCSTNTIYKYDKEQNRFITIKKKNQNQINTNLFEIDNQNNIWFIEESNLILHDIKTGKESVFNISSEISIPKTKDTAISFFIDNNNNKWIGKNGNGFVKINAKNEIEFKYSPKNHEEGIIRSIAQDKQGNIWFGTEKGIIILDKNNYIETIKKNDISNYGLNDNAIYCIKKDKQGNMWIGTYFGGINTFYDKSKQFKYYNNNYNSKGLKASAIRQIIEENENSIWIATEDGGVYNYNVPKDIFYKFNDKNIKTENIHSLQIDKNHNLWIGTFMHGLIKYNLKTKESTIYNTNNSNIPENSIFSLYIDEKNILWVGTASGLVYYEKEHNNFKKLDNNILDNSFVYFITGDRKDNIWLGLRSGGLVKYNTKNSSINQWNTKTTNGQITDNYVTSIIIDSKDCIWFGTNNGGLYYLNKNNKINSLSKIKNINANCIYSIIQDNDSSIWVTSNSGLYKISNNSLNSKLLTTDDGLPDIKFNYTSSFISSNGTLYLGTNKGLITFYPSQITYNNSNPDILFTNISIGGTNINPKKGGIIEKDINHINEITISHNQAKFLGIEFAAILTGINKNTNYQILIEGLNDVWQNIGNQRKFIFPVLPPGKYIFKVRTNHNNIKSITINVTPPFYQTTFAYICYVIIFLLILYFLYKRQEKKLAEKNLIRINILEKEKLREMNDLRRDFFINISHEFKTPLSLIISPAQKLINDYDMPEKAKSLIHDILNNSRRLFDLIQELVNFNKLEILQPKLNISKINIKETISEIINAFNILADEKNINFSTEINDIPDVIFADKSVVEKVITNLLSNAFKFTKINGKVKLNIYTEETKNQIFLIIKVSDTGIGISNENLAKIFEPYFQVKENHDGWGIGLSYIKKLIDAHKGNIFVSSKINEGSCFTVKLNITPKMINDGSTLKNEISEINEQINNKSEFIIPKQTESNNQNKYEILIVEDNSDMQHFLKEAFEKDYTIITANNGKEAISLLERYSPDLIISDLMMPEINGLEFCNYIKTHIETSHIPFILLTAKSGELSTIDGYKCGADAYIEKPFNYIILNLQIKNILQTHENNKEYFKKNPTNIKKIATNPYDEKFLNDIKSIIEKNIPNEDFGINNITETLGISRTVLHVKFKKMTGGSIGDYIKNLRINKAKIMLEQGYSISDTAYATGFSNPNYFSKSFKKETGKTPSEYSKK